ETLDVFLKNGTMNSAGVWSPCSGRPGVVALTKKEDLPRQGQQGLLGTQMVAVVVDAKRLSGKGSEKLYRLPTPVELKAAVVEVEDLEDLFKEIPFGMINEPTPAGGGSGACRAF